MEAYSRLNHKNVLRIFDHGMTHESQRYLVMEWMPVDLERYRDERPDRFSSWDTFASEIAFPVLEALAHCHSQGVAHRDIKPANILITEHGSPILADFGLSKLRYLLQPRQTLGTFASPPFTPPETDDGSFTYSRDVYAFAATCVWALSGSLPSTHTELHQALNGLAVPDQVRGELQSCLAKDPTIRPETATVAIERFSAIQNRTLAARNQTNRKKVAVRLTDYAQKQLLQLMKLTSESYIFVGLNGEQDTASESAFNAKKGPARIAHLVPMLSDSFVKPQAIVAEFLSEKQFSTIPLSGLTQQAELKAQIEALENSMMGEPPTVTASSQTLADRIA